MTKNRVLLSLCVGALVAGGPALVILLNPSSTDTWTHWSALNGTSVLISEWVLRLRTHDSPFVDWSIVLSGVTQSSCPAAETVLEMTVSTTRTGSGEAV